MSELNWSDRLGHLRFSRGLLFLEKWLSLFMIPLLIILSMPLPVISALVVFCAVWLFLAYNSHFNLEEAAGMPVNYVTLKY